MKSEAHLASCSSAAREGGNCMLAIVDANRRTERLLDYLCYGARVIMQPANSVVRINLQQYKQKHTEDTERFL